MMLLEVRLDDEAPPNLRLRTADALPIGCRSESLGKPCQRTARKTLDSQEAERASTSRRENEFDRCRSGRFVLSR